MSMQAGCLEECAFVLILSMLRFHLTYYYPLQTVPDDTLYHDVSVCWSYRMGPLLGAETGVVGWGGAGLTKDGAGFVPPLGITYNKVRAGSVLGACMRALIMNRAVSCVFSVCAAAVARRAAVLFATSRSYCNT